MSILSLLFTQEIYTKIQTLGISSSSALEEDHEARQESRHAMNMTPNDPRTEASICKSSGTQPWNGEAWVARFKPWPWRKWRQRPKCKCTQVRNHARSKPGGNRGRTGLKQAWAGRPGRSAQPIPGTDQHPLWPSLLSGYLSPARLVPCRNTFVIRRRGAEKRGTPFRWGEGRDGWLGFP
jgi:hypothetical protein